MGLIGFGKVFDGDVLESDEVREDDVGCRREWRRYYGFFGNVIFRVWFE